MDEDKSFAQRWEDYQQQWDEYQPSKALWFWSCAGSVLLTLSLGFLAGGWVTKGTAEKMATRAAIAARAELVANACAKNFADGFGFQARLAQLKDADEPRRLSILQKEGWVTLAGMDEPLAAAAASLCADKLANTTMPENLSPSTDGSSG